MDAKKGENDRDSSRAFKWIAIIATFLIIGAVLFTVAWFKRPPAHAPDAPAVTAPATEKPSPQKAPG